MVPGLEEHLVNSSDEETHMITDLVGGFIEACNSVIQNDLNSYRKGPLVPGQMTRKA
jgi:hypothetical protein